MFIEDDDFEEFGEDFNFEELIEEKPKKQKLPAVAS